MRKRKGLLICSHVFIVSTLLIPLCRSRLSFGIIFLLSEGLPFMLLVVPSAAEESFQLRYAQKGLILLPYLMVFSLGIEF